MSGLISRYKIWEKISIRYERNQRKGSIKLDPISKQWVVSSYWELALIIYAPLAYHYEPASKIICTYIYLLGISLDHSISCQCIATQETFYPLFQPLTKQLGLEEQNLRHVVVNLCAKTLERNHMVSTLFTIYKKEY